MIQRYHGKAEVVESKDSCPWNEELRSYFNGDLTALDAIPIAWAGTDFQQKAWQHLRTIPVGKTESYGQMAKALGVPKASRAVGRANGSNPVGLVVPCHRVIGANGSLTGYGFGVDRKRWLLKHEGVEVK
ncbi:methylated-DNA--[protein]-cysteine S-methyltransferase [Telmatocola sphagniphila]|uniref:Methylated-DNA--[protein]-cysteine S-methyltransferase n=2 Tax=Telmatocola sphagniphila TaxID=1123043 RepID=A0A8E6BBP1_9BACT|nr:methylated-DNA--[protein]-cysteine S-methyltransferase [Telmatocola sphagniphila]